VAEAFDQLARATLELVLNSLWLGTVAAIALAAVPAVWRRASAATRYAIWSAALASLVLLPLAAWGARPANAPAEVVGEFCDETITGPASAAPVAAAPVAAPVAPPPAPIVEVSGGDWTLWAFGALALVWALRLGRVAVGFVALVRWRRRCVPLAADRVARLGGWTRHVRAGRTARLVVSPDAKVPMVIGPWRPIVAIPTELVDRLSNAELDDLALHELAHVRRRDDWAKLAEAVVSAVCFFHPAAWWLARRADADREVACDDWVVAATGARCRYARCLLRLAGLGVVGDALPAPGALARKPMLTERIELLMKTDRNAKPTVSKLMLTSLTTLVLVAAIACADSGPAVALNSKLLVEIPPDVSPKSAVAADPGVDDTRGEDLAVRAAAIEALGNRPGTVIVMDAHFGRVLTIVNQDWAVRRTFTPASTAKLITALAALGTGGFDPDAKVAVDSRRLDLDSAMAYSNTEYFQAMGEHAGAERFFATARELGFGRPTGINLPGEVAGRLPEGRLPALLFGGGEGMEVTPLQLAVMTAAIANGGTRVVPFMARESGSTAVAPYNASEDNVWKKGVPIAIPAEHLRRIVPGMLATVRYGTGVPAATKQITVAGKTGSANDPEGNLGLFVSFDKPTGDNPSAFVVVVVVRGKDVLGRTAAGVAGNVWSKLGC
jgi:beta-lactamase regulating signal transducer with metallopeptidase domain/beta-lactamase class D